MKSLLKVVVFLWVIVILGILCGPMLAKLAAIAKP
jgi:hypothetical protein